MSINKSLFTSNSTEWETPQYFYNSLNTEFSFELDPCATDSNHKCSKYFTSEQDGLIQDWGNYRVYCNPPYGRGIDKWVCKCSNHRGLAVMLLPARTDTRWFHTYIYNKPNVEVRFIKGRLKFGDSDNSAPFPSMVVIFRNMENSNA